MKERVCVGRWRSPRAEQAFRAVEDQLWSELWPEPPASRDVDTLVGPTRVYHWPGAGDPLVLLHGTGATSLMWSGVISLLPGRDVYAVDTIGDLGRSRQQIPVEDAADLAAWLDETLAGAGIARAHLAGASYGGFLALNQAIRRPARVRSVALVEPVGIVPLRFVRFLVWGCSVLAASLATSFLPARMRRSASKALRMPVLEDKRIMRMVVRGRLAHRPRLVPPRPFTDEQLAATAVPVLLLVGEKSEVHHAPSVIARATALMPDVAAEIVPGSGHTLPISDGEHVAARLDAFLLDHPSAMTDSTD